MGEGRGRIISPEKRSETIMLIHEACDAGARKVKACNLLNISIRTLSRWEKEGGLDDKRKTANRTSPANKLTEDERQMVLSIANSGKFCDLSPKKIIPLLADEGAYIASESSFYRILREEKQLMHRQLTKPVKHKKPLECVAYHANQVWSWDISYLPSPVKGLYFYLYLIMDIYSRKIVGWSIHETESSGQAACLIQQACQDEHVKEEQLILHSDNGSPMKGMTMLAMLEQLGVIPSFSRPSVSDDNPFSESLFKTLKYHPDFPMLSKFESIEAARAWTEKFVFWYNTRHLHSALKFVTPQQRHTGIDQLILSKRHEVYSQAKRKHPERWTGDTRNWRLPATVTLNPDKKRKRQSVSNNAEILRAA